MSFLHHTICRACGHAELVPVFDLSLQYLANDFRKPGEACNGAYPLKVLHCPNCTLAQLSVVVDPATLYSNYSYVTSKSKTMQEHFAALWKEIQAESPAKHVCEIGSNDGEFLKHCGTNGAGKVLGFEPAKNLAEIARARGIETLPLHFSESTASKLGDGFDVIVARHVFCHIDDWRDFMVAIACVSYKDSLVVIEVPYLLDTLQRCEFDQVYHEHLSFLSLKAMAALLKDSPFQMHKVLRFPVHGGAIAIFLRRKDAGIAPHESVQEMLSQENITEKDWKVFTNEARASINNLGYEVDLQRRSGKIICGFGASAKSTVWINACGFTSKDIAFICDNTPQKQGCLSPGSDIPIVPEAEIEKADVAINFAWNYSEFLKEKLKWWTDKGGVLINPHEL